MPSPTRQVSVYLTDDQLDVLDQLAGADDLTRSSVLRVALESYAAGRGFELPGRKL